MKRIPWPAFLAGFLILILILVIPRHRNVEVQAGDQSAEYADGFLAKLAKVNNRKGLVLEMGDEQLSFDDGSPYLSERASLMFPMDAVSDTFNCSAQVYDNGSILIEKGNNSITLNINSSVATINDNMVELSDRVQSLDGKVYIPISDISEYLNYGFSMDYQTASVHLKQLSEELDIPERYDMRELGRMTPVRDQGLYGTCWAFASLAALETTLTPTEFVTFSPDHMSLSNSFQLGQNVGGEYTMAIAYLASWQGPVYEADDPYGDGETDPHLKACRHLEEAQIIGEKDYDGIKAAVYKYGAVESSIYTQMVTADSWSNYYNRDTAAYYYDQWDENIKCNHDVVIVGWDDNFPKEKFLIQPEHDGAFICKNSWGERFGEDGYFYISYEDAYIGRTNVAYTKLNTADNFDKVYQSDLLGWVGQLGYKKESAFFANVYRAGKGETLEAVSFYATGPDTNYKLYLVKDFQDESDLSDRILLKEGSFENAGYYTVRLEKPEALPDKEDFAVVVYIETPGSIHPVAVEYNADERTREFDIEDGQGFISLYGNKWMNTEESENCNLCLKAFVNTSEQEEESVGTEQELDKE